jgi:hypothetical protein
MTVRIGVGHRIEGDDPGEDKAASGNARSMPKAPPAFAATASRC